MIAGGRDRGAGQGVVNGIPIVRAGANGTAISVVDLAPSRSRQIRIDIDDAVFVLALVHGFDWSPAINAFIEQVDVDRFCCHGMTCARPRVHAARSVRS